MLLFILLFNFILYTEPIQPTYQPKSNSSGPRRIIVSDGNGNYLDTPGGDNDSPDWQYRYNPNSDTWWCLKDGTWYQWHDRGDVIWPFIPISNDWYTNYIDWDKGSPNDEDAIPYSAVPIGDSLCLLIFGAGYLIFKDVGRD